MTRIAPLLIAALLAAPPAPEVPPAPANPPAVSIAPAAGSAETGKGRGGIPPDLVRISRGAAAQYTGMVEEIERASDAEVADFRARILPKYVKILARMDRFANDSAERKGLLAAKERERDRMLALARERRDAFLARLAASGGDYDALLARQGGAFPAAYEIFLRDAASASTDPVRLAAPRVRGAVERGWDLLLEEIASLPLRHASGGK